MLASLTLATCASSARAAAYAIQPPEEEAVTIRVATWDVGSLSTRELLDPASPRPLQIAQVIQRLRPNVLLLVGVAYDMPGGLDAGSGEPPGLNARRLAEDFLAHPQATDLQPMRMIAWMPPTNSGQPSGRDLDRSGTVINEYLAASARGAELDVGFSGDAWGPGAYPGQRGVMLLVDARLEALIDRSRTFRRLPWDFLPAPSMPAGPGGEGEWFASEVRGVVRLSSTTHVDLPIRLPNGAVVHVLGSAPALVTGAPTPARERRARRNRDEIRFWELYIESGEGVVDDDGVPGGLGASADGEPLFDPSFIVLGPLGVTPEDPLGFKDPIGESLLVVSRINGRVVPESSGPDGSGRVLSSSATGQDDRRTDYVLPSTDLGIAAAGVWRVPPVGPDGQPVAFPTERFPVWMDLWIRAPIPAPTAPKP